MGCNLMCKAIKWFLCNMFNNIVVGCQLDKQVLSLPLCSKYINPHESPRGKHPFWIHQHIFLANDHPGVQEKFYQHSIWTWNFVLCQSL